MTKRKDRIELKVDKDVPLPPKPNRLGCKAKYRYPWDQMEVGDSFELPGRQEMIRRTTVANAKKRGRKYAIRNVGEGRVRVWRVA